MKALVVVPVWRIGRYALALSAVIFAVCANVSALALSKSEVSTLVEPIALYPDPLLKQILPASTFPDQIADAALLIQTKADAALIKDQSWDPSVKVIAGYPGVLKMMYQKLDWTERLGNSFLEQHEDVLGAIQTLRARAQANGNLKTTKGQAVNQQTDGSGNTYITIEPSDPQVIYVPQETSSTVYTQPVDTTSSALVPVASFGLGMLVGAAIADDDDDDHYYYGGYYGGPMWVDDDWDDWADTRRARNEDRHDEIMDRQEHRQGQREDRQEFRQDWARDNPDKVNRENAQQARQNFQEKRPERAQTLPSNQANRAQQRSDARASMESRGFSSAPATKRSPFDSQAGSWAGQGGSSYANRTSSRGSSSRSSFGSSSYGGGGMRSSGGMRGGGGGFRGGGGRGGRR